MRISTSWSQQQSVNAMLNQQSKLSKTQLQLSTGLKNLTPADDPVAVSNSLKLQASIDQTTQYQENINVARSTNTLESTTLTNAVDVLQNARELAVQSLNSGVLTDSDKQAIGYQVKEILGNMLSLANTTNNNGEFIFSGYQSKTTAFKAATPATDPQTYTYQGGTEQRSLQVATDRQIADSDLGSSVFGFTSAVDGAPQNILNTLSTLADALTNPSAATYQATVTKALSDIDTGLNSISDAQSKAGSRLIALDAQESQHEKLLVDTKTTLSNIQDLDYASAISQFSQQETSLQAAQQSYAKIQRLSLFEYL